MKLSANQEFILRAYARQCHPEFAGLDKEDFAFLTKNRFIHPEQDHITDKGLAYVVGIMGMSYTKFISKHNWQKRHEAISWPVKNIFHSKEEQDIYFRETYKIKLKYETWGQAGNEKQADFITLRKIGAETCLALLDAAGIDWKKVRGWLCARTIDPENQKLLEGMQSKEYLKEHLARELAKLTAS